MTYNKQLPNSDSIEVGTYHKCRNSTMHNLRFMSVYVASIDTGNDTVNARIGETAEYKDYPKEALFAYINHGCYSN